MTPEDISDKVERFEPKPQRALWISTSLDTRGGIASYVRAMQQTRLWREWNIRHVATHCDGTAYSKIVMFARGLLRYCFELVLRRPDVVHIHTSSYGSFARKFIISWLALFARIPVILHVHGSEFHKFYNASPPTAKVAIRTTLEHVNTVIALGETWRMRLETIAPAAHIEVLPNAMSLKSAVDHIDGDQVHVVFLGEVCDRKGTFLLLEAWSQVAGKLGHRRIRLTIAGNGEVERARCMVKNLSLEQSVDVTGWLPAADVDRLLSTAQILALPSINEGQPMAILEAMARGICVVASRSGGIPDMLDDSSGILVDPLGASQLHEALTLAICDRATRSRLGMRARSRVEQEFNIESVAARTNVLYSAITSPFANRATGK